MLVIVEISIGMDSIIQVGSFGEHDVELSRKRDANVVDTVSCKSDEWWQQAIGENGWFEVTKYGHTMTHNQDEELASLISWSSGKRQQLTQHGRVHIRQTDFLLILIFFFLDSIIIVVIMLGQKSSRRRRRRVVGSLLVVILFFRR